LAAPKNNLLDSNDLNTIRRIATKNWWVVLGLALLSYAVGYFYTYRLTDVYAAQTQILLKANEKEYNPGSIIGENFSGFSGGYQSYIDNSNEMRVMKSYDLIKRAVDKIKLDVSYYIVGRLRTTEEFENIPFIVFVNAINPALFENKIKFRVVDLRSFELTYEKDGKEVTKQFKFDKEAIESDFNLLVKNTGVHPGSVNGLKNVNYLIQIHNKDGLVYKFQSAMRVENPDYTNILQVTLEDVLPQRAAIFLDTLSRIYIDNTLKSRIEINDNTLYYIDKQMEEVSGILSSIEDTMQNYKESKAILSFDREESEYFAKLSQYKGENTGLMLQLDALNSLEKYIIERKDPELLPPSVYINTGDGFLHQNISQLYNLQMERNFSLASTKETNFVISVIDQKIEALRKNLLIYISNLRTAIKTKMDDINRQIENYVGDIKTLPEKQRGLVTIQRKLNVNESMYTFLLQKRATTFIAKASIIPETKIIEVARPIGIVRPDRNKIIYTFVGIGALLGLIIAFIRSVVFEKVESIDELRQKTNLPIVGEIIFSPNIKELVIAIENDAKSAITESFRTIRTNLQYMGTDNVSKVVVLTSNSPGEGKTFCSANLAAILAKAGKKVLLLELDLHKPKVQKAFNMTSDIGISNIIIGQHEIKHGILNTHIESLDVMLSGPLPPNASELILSERLKDIISYGKANYDYVIMDSPPVGLISDAIILMRYSDVVLFVLNTKFAHKEAISNAEEIVEANKISNFGFVLNGVKRRRSKYYYNKYSYGYGYGYGYTKGPNG
jgi:tyrosine-protein kinase Etk/Wzc